MQTRERAHCARSVFPFIKKKKSLFSEDVTLALLTQVKDDSQLSLQKKLSSLKGGRKAASTSSSSGYRRRDSSSSLSRGRGSKSFRDAKLRASSSPSRRSKVAFKGILRSPTLIKGLSK